MKNLELEMMGVQEMNIVEMSEYTGGIDPILIPVIIVGVAAVVLYVMGIPIDNKMV